MKSEHRYGVIAAWCVGFLFLASGLWAQEAAVPRHVGYPQDWSSNSLVFSLDGLAKYPDLINREPRVRHQLMQRFQMREPSSFSGVIAGAKSGSKLPPQVTWPIALTRGKVAANMFPAKFSFDPGATPSCQNDFVVFGLNVGGKTGGQANLIGINNLYSGTNGFCGAAPTVLFAYNVTTATGGIVTTSPVISEDGTKIAFVESVSGATPSAIFHVLTWAPTSNTITTAAAPGAALASVTLSVPNPSTTSSPWVDYQSDTAYVADDGGNVYQITGVFHGTPTLSGAPWPVSVSGGRLSPTVLDNRLQKLVVAARTGNLYTIDITTATIAATLPIGKSGSITAPPIVDVTNGTTFIVSSTDGTSAVLVEADTATLLQLANARIGLGAGTGGGATLTIPQPAFSNDYYNNPTTGVIRLCGTGSADTTPWQYSFGFTGRTMNITPAFSQSLLTSTAARCTNWTEFFNPNVGIIGTDFFFFGLTQDCTGTGTSGCVVARTTDAAPLATTPVAGGPSGIVIDNYGTAPQEANIYLTAEGAGVSTAYKFSQNGLQ